MPNPARHLTGFGMTFRRQLLIRRRSQIGAALYKNVAAFFQDDRSILENDRSISENDRSI